MSVDFILEEEIDRWLQEEGTPYVTVSLERTIKVIPVNVRREKLEILFFKLKGFGVTRDYFRGPNRETIARACLPVKKTIRPRVYRELYTLVCKDIDYVRVEVFGTASDDSKLGKTHIVTDFKSREELEGEKDLDDAPNKPVFSDSKPEVEPKPKSKEFDQSAVEGRDECSTVIDPNLEEWLRDK